jgi:signal transduction histidine kinase
MVGGLLDAQRRVCARAADPRTRLPDPEIVVRIDRDAAEQIVLNLIDNALKYAAGGRTIEVEATRSAVRVLDRGAGVPVALRERIFEKFYRIDQSLTANVPGTGLGLSIARRLARDCWRRFFVLSARGGGLVSSGILRLPAARLREGTARMEPAAHPVARGRPAHRQGLADAHESEGYEVESRRRRRTRRCAVTPRAGRPC